MLDGLWDLLNTSQFRAVGVALYVVNRAQDMYSGPVIRRFEYICFSIASQASLRSSNLVHLRDSLLEFLVLTFLVAVSFALKFRQQILTFFTSLYCFTPHTSMADSTRRLGICSVVLGDERNCLCKGGVTERQPWPFCLRSLRRLMLETRSVACHNRRSDTETDCYHPAQRHP